MVHNSKALIQVLINFILTLVTSCRTAVEVSPVKQDGTVFIKFRSSPQESASELSYRFVEQLNLKKVQFVQTDDHKFRLALDQFRSMV
jgi:hypothetical protein